MRACAIGMPWQRKFQSQTFQIGNETCNSPWKNRMSSFLRRIRDAGGVRSAFRTLLRVRDMKAGSLVGTDKFGNEYYENKDYIFSRNRWVYLARRDWDASQIPPEWHMWLHHMTEPSPIEKPPQPQKFLQDHEANPSGTRDQYVPYSTTRPKIQSWQPPKTSTTTQ